MMGHACMKSLTICFLVTFLPLNPFWSREVQNVNCFSAPTKSASHQKLQRSQQQLESRLEFHDEVLHFLDGQPQVSYRNVDIPWNILTAYPMVSKIGNKFIELERKCESVDEGKEMRTRNVILLHLISSPTRLEECLPPRFQKDLTDYFNHDMGGTTDKPEYSKVIHLHEDIWNFKQGIVHHRLMAQLGLGLHVESRRTSIRRIFARKTIVRRITPSVAMKFLEENHLWGATKARHNYGLFVVNKGNNESNDPSEEELVAVATFSPKRKIVRLGKPHRSHELVRFCSKRDSNVVGGISKLMKAFINEHSPDDIVTMVDRDWGDGSGWHSLGFHTVTTRDPMVMAVCQSIDNIESSDSKRRHLIGDGIQIHNVTRGSDNIVGGNGTGVKKNDRIGLSAETLQELDCLDSIEDILCTLSRHKLFPVYDTGVERLMKVISYDSDGKEVQTTSSSVLELYQNSQPTFAKDYYSPNLGISALLKHVSMTPSALPALLSGDSNQSYQRG